MSAAPRPESAAAAAIDLELVGVAAAVLDYSHAADRLARLAEPTDALDDPWVVQELAATVIVIDLNQRAAAALGAEAEALRAGHLFPLIEMTSGMLDSFKAQFQQIVDGSLTSRTEVRSADGNELILVDWRAADESYRRVVLTLRDISATPKTPIDLNATVEMTVAVARNEWKYHSEIALDLDDGLPPVPALADPLEQAILGIIINAAQAVEDAVSDSGHKGTIAISTSQRGDMAQIKITDSGGGIAPEIQNRIFDPFFTTREVGRGSGQGLTICRTAIVDQHGGTLEFESEPGVGTTFIASLPLHMEEDYA